MRRRGRSTKEYYCDVQLCAAVFSVVGRPTQLIYILDFYLDSVCQYIHKQKIVQGNLSARGRTGESPSKVFQ